MDGVRVKLIPFDIDGDGVAGEVESISTHKEQGVIDIRERSELGEALEYQNKDITDSSKLSSVDFVSRISPFQLSALVAVDTIASMGVISKDAKTVVRNLMRKSVSIDGKGRQEFVDVVVGKKEFEIRKGMGNLAGSGQIQK